jgi:hypothetical protein
VPGLEGWEHDWKEEAGVQIPGWLINRARNSIAGTDFPDEPRLWKVYEPRWPRSADGKWYWKFDTSSDEPDGHYFFYRLYYNFCADTDAERGRVRKIGRDLTDHLLAYQFDDVQG